MNNKNLVIKIDKVITIANGDMRWIAYRDEGSGHMVFVKCEELNMDELHRALEIIQGAPDTGI
jgi:hypothetical protein